MSEPITIDGTGELMIYVESVCGWGRGKTIAEALEHFQTFSRGWLNCDYTHSVSVPGKKRPIKRTLVDLLADQDIRIWMTDDPHPEWGKLCSVSIHTGYHYIHLGDAYNTARIFDGNEDSTAQ